MDNGQAPSPNPANRSSPDMGLFFFLEENMRRPIEDGCRKGRAA